MKVQEALIAVMKAIPAVKKSERNDSQRFNFRGIDSVLNAVGPQFRKYGVFALPVVVEHHSEEILVGAKGTKMRSVTILVDYVFTGPEGDSITARVLGEAMDSGDKAFSKAMSVAFRTALLQTLALPTDEPDPDSESPSRGEQVLSPLQTAKRELYVKAKAQEISTEELLTLYLGDTGQNLKEETDVERLRDFTKRLGA